MNPRRPSPPLTLELVTSRPGSRPRPIAREPREAQLVDVTLRADERLLLSVEDAAQRLSIGRTLMYELLTTGQIESIQVGRLRRVPAEALSNFVRRQAGRPDPAA